MVGLTKGLKGDLVFFAVAQRFDDAQHLLVRNITTPSLQFVLVNGVAKFGSIRGQIGMAVGKLPSLKPRRISFAARPTIKESIVRFPTHTV